jgi:[ribosomal protein S18]-alanine N-acetyltransferase
MADKLRLIREALGVEVAFCEAMQGVGEAEILAIEVAQSHRRQGLALSLLKELFDWARQNKRSAVWLEVRASNDAAIKLYLRMGFLQISTRKRYYADGEDALVMKYSL